MVRNNVINAISIINIRFASVLGQPFRSPLASRFILIIFRLAKKAIHTMITPAARKTIKKITCCKRPIIENYLWLSYVIKKLADSMFIGLFQYDQLDLRKDW